MELALFLVYLAGVSSKISFVAVFLLILGGTMGLVTFLGCAVGGCLDSWRAIVNKIKWYVIGFFLVAIVTPSTQLLYIAAGLSAGEDIADTEIAQKAYTLLNRHLDELLNPPEQSE